MNYVTVCQLAAATSVVVTPSQPDLRPVLGPAWPVRIQTAEEGVYHQLGRQAPESSLY